MENSLLMDAVERFLHNEMPDAEREYFMNLRQTNPEVDQAVVEHLFFLNQLNEHSAAKRFQRQLMSAHQDMRTEGAVQMRGQKRPAKVVQLWNKHKRVIELAASIAGVVSLLIASLVSGVSNHKNANITPLVQKINEQEKKTKQIENKLNQLQERSDVAAAGAVIIAKFRATGFMIDAEHNYIATNAHVVSQAKNNLIIEDKDGKQFAAKPVYVNDATDLAIIKVDDTAFDKLPAVPFRLKKNAELGEHIFMLGYPKQEVVYGEGYISAKNGYEMDSVFCQLNTSANEGSSGSPVITDNGDLVGIISSKQTNAAGVVYAIKSSNLFRAVDEARKIEGNENLKIGTGQPLKGASRVAQIKKLENYIFMIKGN